MKVKVTEKGVHDADEKPVPVGTVLELKKINTLAELPGFLINKCVLVGAAGENAAPVLNEAALQTAKDEAAAEAAGDIKTGPTPPAPVAPGGPPTPAVPASTPTK